MVARFDGGPLSSDAGVLVLREVEQRLGVAERLAGCIADPRAQAQVVHGLADMIRFRMLMIAAGYEDGNDASSLRSDPAFKLAQGALPSGPDLASQPTISRLENLPDRRSLLRMGQALVDLYCASFREVPKSIVLDIDDTFDAVHGGQQLRLFGHSRTPPPLLILHPLLRQIEPVGDRQARMAIGDRHRNCGLAAAHAPVLVCHGSGAICRIHCGLSDELVAGYPGIETRDDDGAPFGNFAG